MKVYKKENSYRKIPPSSLCNFERLLLSFVLLVDIESTSNAIVWVLLI